MKRSKALQPRSRGCRALCCSCRISVSSSEEEGESSSSSGRFPSISSIAHAMVQERLDQMIRERGEAMRTQTRRRRRDEEETRFVVLVAVEKCSYDPREDFRESVEQMIVSNRVREAKDLRRLLNYYLTMNSEDFRGIILEVFHDVCTALFLENKIDMGNAH